MIEKFETPTSKVSSLLVICFICSDFRSIKIIILADAVLEFQGKSPLQHKFRRNIDIHDSLVISASDKFAQFSEPCVRIRCVTKEVFRKNIYSRNGNESVKLQNV